MAYCLVHWLMHGIYICQYIGYVVVYILTSCGLRSSFCRKDLIQTSKRCYIKQKISKLKTFFETRTKKLKYTCCKDKIFHGAVLESKRASETAPMYFQNVYVASWLSFLTTQEKNIYIEKVLKYNLYIKRIGRSLNGSLKRSMRHK